MTGEFKASNPDYARAVRESFGKQGLMGTLGARIVAIEPGLCVIEMPYAASVSQQQGYFHGGAIGAIADVAAGYAAYSLMPAGADILTVEYKLNLIRPACRQRCAPKGGCCGPARRSPSAAPTSIT